MGEFYVTNHLLRNQLQAWVEEEKKKRVNGKEEEKIGDEDEVNKEEGC